MTTLASPLSRSRRRRRILLLVVGAGIAVALAVVGALAATTAMSSLSASVIANVRFSPSEADGLVPEGEPLGIGDGDHPAIARLDPGLRDAVAAAQASAVGEGIVFDITSGWRSESYQRWLLDEAIVTYGSEDVARAYVATPELSSHVTGRAVDVGSLDAQLWLVEHGREWGLCQTYANERWHFEKATEPGGECPWPRTDARG